MSQRCVFAGFILVYGFTINNESQNNIESKSISTFRECFIKRGICSSTWVNYKKRLLPLAEYIHHTKAIYPAITVNSNAVLMHAIITSIYLDDKNLNIMI